MGIVKTAYQLRLARAIKLLRQNHVEPNGAPGRFLVWSGTSPDKSYDVVIQCEDGEVLATRCTVHQSIDPGEVGQLCPDWQRMQLAMDECGGVHPGISHVNYSPACKHTLACLLKMGIVEEARP